MNKKGRIFITLEYKHSGENGWKILSVFHSHRQNRHGWLTEEKYAARFPNEWKCD